MVRLKNLWGNYPPFKKSEGGDGAIIIESNATPMVENQHLVVATQSQQSHLRIFGEKKKKHSRKFQDSSSQTKANKTKIYL